MTEKPGRSRSSLAYGLSQHHLQRLGPELGVKTVGELTAEHKPGEGLTIATR